MKLSKTIVERYCNSKVPIAIWDSNLKGFSFRVSPKGKCSWVVKRRLGKGGKKAKQVQYVLGVYPTMDYDKAYSEALLVIGKMNEGTNPANEKRRIKNKQHSDYANGKLKDVYQVWFDKHAKDKDAKDGYWYRVNRRFTIEIIPKLGEQTLVADITKADVMKLLDDKEKLTKSGARQLFNALVPFFKWCLSRELIEASPMTSLSPPERYQDRDRVLTDNELVLVWKAASALPYPWGAFYRLAILTAQRRDEVAQLPWIELDLSKTSSWIIPGARTKNGKEHLVHLSPWAKDILHSIADKSGDTLAFTTKKLGDLEYPISGFSKSKLLLDKTIKAMNGDKAIPAWRIHDLRRTAATGMASIGTPPHIVERILNHISGSTGGLVGIYQRHEYVEERRQAIVNWSNHINELVLNDCKEERKSDYLNNIVQLRNTL